jgi:hypothetical protein
MCVIFIHLSLSLLLPITKTAVSSISKRPSNKQTKSKLSTPNAFGVYPFPFAFLYICLEKIQFMPSPVDKDKPPLVVAAVVVLVVDSPDPPLPSDPLGQSCSPDIGIDTPDPISLHTP